MLVGIILCTALPIAAVSANMILPDDPTREWAIDDGDQLYYHVNMQLSWVNTNFVFGMECLDTLDSDETRDKIIFDEVIYDTIEERYMINEDHQLIYDYIFAGDQYDMTVDPYALDQQITKPHLLPVLIFPKLITTDFDTTTDLVAQNYLPLLDEGFTVDSESLVTANGVTQINYTHVDGRYCNMTFDVNRAILIHADVNTTVTVAPMLNNEPCLMTYDRLLTDETVLNTLVEPYHPYTMIYNKTTLVNGELVDPSMFGETGELGMPEYYLFDFVEDVVCNEPNFGPDGVDIFFNPTTKVYADRYVLNDGWELDLHPWQTENTAVVGVMNTIDSYVDIFNLFGGEYSLETVEAIEYNGTHYTLVINEVIGETGQLNASQMMGSYQISVNDGESFPIIDHIVNETHTNITVDGDLSMYDLSDSYSLSFDGPPMLIAMPLHAPGTTGEDLARIYGSLFTSNMIPMGFTTCNYGDSWVNITNDAETQWLYIEVDAHGRTIKHTMAFSVSPEMTIMLDMIAEFGIMPSDNIIMPVGDTSSTFSWKISPTNMLMSNTAYIYINDNLEDILTVTDPIIDIEDLEIGSLDAWLAGDYNVTLELEDEFDNSFRSTIRVYISDMIVVDAADDFLMPITSDDYIANWTLSNVDPLANWTFQVFVDGAYWEAAEALLNTRDIAYTDTHLLLAGSHNITLMLVDDFDRVLNTTINVTVVDMITVLNSGNITIEVETVGQVNWTLTVIDPLANWMYRIYVDGEIVGTMQYLLDQETIVFSNLTTLDVGTHNITLELIDSFGRSVNSTIVITVEEPNWGLLVVIGSASIIGVVVILMSYRPKRPFVGRKITSEPILTNALGEELNCDLYPDDPRCL